MLRWKDVPGATGYELQIAKDAAFSEVVLQTRTPTAGYKWESLPSVTHWWRVRSFDAEGRPSEWSQPRSISVDSAVPNAKGPADNSVFGCGATVEATFEPAAVIREYVVTVSANADFSAPREFRAKSPTVALTGLESGTWRWRVRGLDVKGALSEPGPARVFTIRPAAPKLKVAQDLVLGAGAVTLTWSDVGCAASWVIEATADTRERVALTSSQTSLPFKAVAAGDYRWRVAAVDARGVQGDWSSESTFKVRLGTPLPRQEVVTKHAELSWSPVAGAMSYRVDVTSQERKSVVASGTSNTTSWKSGELAPGRYSWRVSARDTQSHTSASSEARTFIVLAEKPLPGPVITSPEEGAVVNVGAPLHVGWHLADGATHYEVELDGESLGMLGASVLTTPPLSEGPHRVRVRARADGGRTSDWSAPVQVHAGVPPVVSATVEQVDEEVRVHLLDAAGHDVVGATPRFGVREGALSAVSSRDDTWVMQWVAPVSGRDELVVTERGFSQSLPLTLVERAPIVIGLAAGGIFSGTAITSPTAVLDGAYRLPLWRRRAAVELRVGVFGAQALVPTVGGMVTASAVGVPISLLAAWHQPVGAFTLRGGLGPMLLLTSLRVGDDSALSVTGGIEACVGVSRRLGPGSVWLDVAGSFSRVDTALAKLNAGGFALRVGYALDLLGAR